MSTDKYTDKALAKIADLIINRMETLKGDKWEKPWFDIKNQGVPKNVSGNPYNGMNTLVLAFESAVKQRELPVYLTFNQAMKEGVHIKKGSVSTPILYYERTYYDENGKKIPEEVVREMSSEEKTKIMNRAVLRKFDVFNIADTNFQEIHPERYNQLKKEYNIDSVKDSRGMYSNAELDRMFLHQEWLCPINIKRSNSAYYNALSDHITIPEKWQFNKSQTPVEIYRDGMNYYATALHEMAHSTGHPDRLNRTFGKFFGDPKYAKEELIAELTSALIGRTVGFEKKVADNSAKYLNNWVEILKSEPRYLLSLLSDVAKSSNMILSEIHQQSIKVKQDYADEIKSQQSEMTSKISDATLVKMHNGDYAVRAKVDNRDTGLLNISSERAAKYLQLSNEDQKSTFLKQVVSERFNTLTTSAQPTKSKSLTP